jgi:SAM-dependent methyltransferase
MPPASDPLPPESLRAALERVYGQALEPVTECMFTAAAIARGMRVLDVGSGTGDTALRAARATGPDGLVLATDVSLERMAPLAERSRALPAAARIDVLACAAEQLALGPATFDVALARNSLMYCHDLRLAVRNVRRALRAGGRFVASCYGPLEREPYHAIPIAAVRRRCELREPFPEYVQAFRVGAADLEQAFDTAGFLAVVTRVVPTLRSYSSLAAALDLLRASPSLGRLMSRVPASQHDDTWTEIADAFRAYARPDGLLVPGEQVVVVGTVPGVRTGG